MKLYFKIFKFILLGFILSSGTQAWSQSKALKLNLNMGFDRDNSESYVGRLAPVLIIETKTGDLHQIEWTSFSISQFSDRDEDSTNQFSLATYGGIDISFRYQYSIPLTKNSKNVIPYLGISGRMGVAYEYDAPLTSDEFYTHATDVFTRLGLVPTLRFRASKRLFLDVEIPLEFINLYSTWSRTDNPALPLRQQQTTEIGMEINRPPLHLRFGLGVKL
jgi:hypothetical protein